MKNENFEWSWIFILIYRPKLYNLYNYEEFALMNDKEKRPEDKTVYIRSVHTVFTQYCE